MHGRGRRAVALRRKRLAEARERVCLCVEDPAVEVQDRVVCEQQVQVLHGFPQEERLHVPRVRHLRVLVHGGVRNLRVPGHLAVCAHPAVLLDGLEDLPACLSVLGVARGTVHVEQRLNRLRAQPVVRPDDLRRALRRRPRLHLRPRRCRELGDEGVARQPRRGRQVLVRAERRHLLRLRHVAGPRGCVHGARGGVPRPQRQHARDEAGQVLRHLLGRVVRVSVRRRQPDAARAERHPHPRLDVHVRLRQRAEDPVRCANVQLSEPAVSACRRRRRRRRLAPLASSLGQQVLLQQVLVVRVRPRTRPLRSAPPPRLRRLPLVADQAVVARVLGELAEEAAHTLVVRGVAGGVRQVAVLELHRARLRKEGAVPAQPLSPARVVPVVRHAVVGGQGLLRVHRCEHVCHLDRLLQQHRPVRQRIGGEEPAREPDGRLEHRDGRRGREPEVLLKMRHGGVELVAEPRDVQRVQRIHQGDHLLVAVVPVLRFVRHAVELVRPESVRRVRVPRPLDRLPHAVPPERRRRLRLGGVRVRRGPCAGAAARRTGVRRQLHRVRPPPAAPPLLERFGGGRGGGGGRRGRRRRRRRRGAALLLQRCQKRLELPLELLVCGGLRLRILDVLLSVHLAVELPVQRQLVELLLHGLRLLHTGRSQRLLALRLRALLSGDGRRKLRRLLLEAALGRGHRVDLGAEALQAGVHLRHQRQEPVVPLCRAAAPCGRLRERRAARVEEGCEEEDAETDGGKGCREVSTEAHHGSPSPLPSPPPLFSHSVQ
eukprot:Rhum_TRINITY_DN7972_c0_g1::Rhum_TRINITY_DN7972_c0_g1_i1::g.25483::m.25483